MSVNKTPGVYVQEITKLPPSVAEVETAIPAFIGYTEKAVGLNGEALKNVPTRIVSLLEYEKFFGGAYSERFGVVINEVVRYTAAVVGTGTAVAPQFPEVKKLVSRDVSVALPDAIAAETTGSPRNAAFAAGYSKLKLYYHLQMYFANGGGPCYIVSVGNYTSSTVAGAVTTITTGAILKADYSLGLQAIEKIDEPTLLLFPEAAGGLLNSEYYDLAKDSLAQCNKLMDRFAVLDVAGAANTEVTDFRNGVGNNFLKYGSAYYPNVNTNLTYGFDLNTVKVTTHTRQQMDAAGNLTAAPVAATAVTVGPFLKSEEYTTKSISTIADQTLTDSVISAIRKTYINNLPSSSSIVGVMAQVDNDRGVWKAPANVSLNYVRSLTMKDDGTLLTIDDGIQDGLNVDVLAGKSINAIRSFMGKGIMVWGSRTLAGNDNEWRYVPVRRFFNFVEESCQKSTGWAVFEPNDANTWLRVKAQLENFLNNLWRRGALQGAKPDHAYYVSIGLGSTMTAQDILEGRMIVEIGMAAVRPAEFIILKFSHLLARS
jgi:uncharacterized protein